MALRVEESVMMESGPAVSNVSTFEPIDGLYQENFNWEKIDHNYWAEWMRGRWYWSSVVVLIYFSLIHLGQFWMRDREPFKLRKPLILWNILLALLSIAGFLRCFPELFMTLQGQDGFHHSVCSWHQRTMPVVFWELVGTWSKVMELGDTAFIILRKQPLIFLHWYHHATVLMYTWVHQPTNDPSHGWFMVMNYGVHSLMYSYYALRALGIKIPRQISVCITSLQILQMIGGLTVSIYAANAKLMGKDCQKQNGNIFFSLLMYCSYCVLFVQFFRRAYVSKPKTTKSD